MTWIFWVQIAVIVNVVEKTLSRNFLKDTNNHYEFLIGYNLGALVFASTTVYLSTTIASVTMTSIVLLTLSGFLWYYSCLWSLKVDEKVGAAETNLIAQVYLVLVVIGGIAFFHDSISLLKALGILLIISGISPIIKFGAISKKSLALKLGSAALMAFAMLLDKRLSHSIPPALITLSGYGVPFLIGPLQKGFDIGRIWSYSKNIFFINIGIGVLSAIGYFALIVALSRTQVSSVVLLYQTRLILITFASIALLKEKEHLRMKLISSLLIFLGTVVIQWH